MLTDARFLQTLLIFVRKNLSAELTPMLSRALPLAPLRHLSSYPDRPTLVEVQRTAPPRLCFLEFGAAPAAEAFQALETLRTLMPTLPIIAVLASNDPELALACVRQGAADFLIAPITPEQIQGCLDRVGRQLQFSAEPAHAGRLIGITSAKGGCGATTLACTLAWQCNKRRNPTLLADLDPLTGTVSFLLKLKSAYSFVDVLHRREELDMDLWKQMVTSLRGVDVLLAPETLVDPHELTSASPVLEYARNGYETLILDLGTLANDWSLSAARSCDDLLLVTTTDVSALHAAQRKLAWFQNAGIGRDKIRLVVDRYVKGQGLNLDRVSEALDGIEVFATIPADPESVGKALMEAKSVAPGTPYAKAAAKLVATLLPEAEPGSAAGAKAASKKQASGRGGLISSRVSGLISSMFSKA